MPCIQHQCSASVVMMIDVHAQQQHAKATAAEVHKLLMPSPH
jgi:hypothetical protein